MYDLWDNIVFMIAAGWPVVVGLLIIILVLVGLLIF